MTVQVGSNDFGHNLPFIGDLAIAHASGVVPCLVLLRRGTDRQKAGAARALGALANHEDNRQQLFRNKGMESLLQLLDAGTMDQKEAVAGALRTIASYPDGKDAIYRCNDDLKRDVWVTSGRSLYNHPGKNAFRKLVEERLYRWMQATDSQERIAVCHDIYETVQGEFRRFLGSNGQDANKIDVDGHVTEYLQTLCRRRRYY